MAEKICCICGKKIGVMSGRIDLKDGVACSKCWKAKGYNTFTDVMKKAPYLTADNLRNNEAPKPFVETESGAVAFFNGYSICAGQNSVVCEKDNGKTKWEFDYASISGADMEEPDVLGTYLWIRGLGESKDKFEVLTKKEMPQGQQLINYINSKCREKQEEVRTARFEEKGKSAYNQLVERMIANPSLSLKKGEVCFYSGAAKTFNVQKVLKGIKQSGLGLGIEVLPGLAVGGGGGKGKAVYEDVKEVYPAEFFITNFRLVLLSKKYGFEIPITEINRISPYSNGVEIYARSKNYVFMTENASEIEYVIDLMNRGFAEQEIQDEQNKNSSNTEKKPKESAEEDKIALLREYKKLFDDGIITEEEFNKKKAELLK